MAQFVVSYLEQNFQRQMTVKKIQLALVNRFPQARKPS